ncbi:discoidin domain-containing protein [Actinoplanes sp. CA-252034]|uniref:discoidin domain-containing protein n=1 Tax=Actinoplanes sp. CA-252034 TaxID=3239906 RepID=UPI003D96D36C
MKALAALLCALLPALPAPDPVHLTVNPRSLPLTTGPCNARDLSVRLANTSTEPVYADAELAAPKALHLQRTLVSTWLPAGYTRAVPVRVSAATGTPPGAHQVRVSSGDQHVDVPVTVTAPPPEAGLTARAAEVTAASFRAANPICAAADGDPTTFWSDGTNRVWPDWFQLDWPTPVTVSRADVATPAEGGLRDWDVQVWAGGWQTVATVRGNTATARAGTFAPRSVTALRILTRAGNGVNDLSRIAELTVS